MYWEHFDHGADIGVRGYGVSPDEAFAQAALAMTAVVTDPATVKPAVAVAITCEAPDLELLLVDWLNALIFEMATRKMLFACFAARIEGVALRGEAWGETMDRARHPLAVLPSPDSLEESASNPLAVLLEPVVLEKSASNPLAVFS